MMTSHSATCCCDRPYSERRGISGHYCPKGNRPLCQEYATEGKKQCPTHKVPVRF